MLSALLLSSSFLAFAVASLVLALTPGPAVIYLVTRTLAEGRKAGLASIGGIAVGNMGNAAVAAIGLAAVLAASATVFTVVKLAGAAYLIGLGLRALFAAPAAPRQAAAHPTSAHATATPAAAPPSLRPPADRMFRDAFWVALLNPKTALFFAALLPQFIVPGASALAQSLVLGGVFVTIALCTDTLYVLTAAVLAPAIARRSGWAPYGRYVTSAAFMGLGVYAALANPRAAALQ